MKVLKTALKIIVSLLLLVAMFYLAGPKAIVENIAQAKLLYLFCGFLVILAGTLIAAYRWWTVMKALNFRGDISFYIKSYFKGIFFNQLLPSSIGGDAVRVINVASLGYEKRHAFIGVLIDRGLGIVGIFIVNIVFNNLPQSILPPELHNGLNFISVAGIVGFIFFAIGHKFSFLNKYKWYKVIATPSKALFDVISTPRKCIFQIVLTVSVHLLTFGGTYFIAKALGVDLSIAIFMVVMPPVILLTIIPISLAGWGIREGAMVGLLGFAGVSKTLAVAISVLYGLNYVLQGIAGLYFQIRYKGMMKGR